MYICHVAASRGQQSRDDELCSLLQGLKNNKEVVEATSSAYELD